MNYDAVNIKPANVLFHLDLEKDIQKQQNGLFTFIFKIAKGSVCDYNIVEYVDVRKYFKLKLKRIVIEEFTSTRTINVGDRKDPMGTDNS
jgi:uncharacterized PurR-regulated membrane protein YhhQ (DUF165 family)